MKALVLKSVYNDGSAFDGFIWPTSGKVICPDWNPEPICGGGLYGLLWGEGFGRVINHSEDAWWLVLEVESESIVDLDGKVKFPECEVIYCGKRDVAIEMILERNPNTACCYARKMVGDKEKVIVGDYRQATAGIFGQATAGNCGQAIAKKHGIAAVGHGGTATVGSFGQAIAGVAGQAIVGDCGKAQCGKDGSISITYFDGKRHRVLTGYAGEDIEADVMYEVQDGKFVKV